MVYTVINFQMISAATQNCFKIGHVLFLIVLFNLLLFNFVSQCMQRSETVLFYFRNDGK